MNPIVIPADTPDYSRDWLLSLDGAIAAEAWAYHGSDTDIARIVVGRRWHGRADGATAFFLFHWMRLFEAGGSPQARAAFAKAIVGSRGLAAREGGMISKERFLANVMPELNSGCWLWMGPERGGTGYGSAYVDPGIRGIAA